MAEADTPSGRDDDPAQIPVDASALKNRNIYSRAWILFAAVALIRLILTLPNKLLPSCGVDIGGYMDWSFYLADHGFLNWGQFYSDKHVVYAPFYMYFLYLTGLISKVFFRASAWYMVPDFFVKIWAVGADIGGMALIYLLGKRMGRRKAGLLLGITYALNPAVVFNSSIWGQFDGFTSTFLLLALYLFFTEREGSGIVFFLIACLTKPQAGLLAPIVLILSIKAWMKNRGTDVESGWYAKLVKLCGNLKFLRRKNTALALALLVSCPLVYLAVVLPFYQPSRLLSGMVKAGVPSFLAQAADWFLWVPDLFSRSVQDYPYAAANSFNFWFLAGKQTVADKTVWMSLSFSTWGMILSAVLIMSYVLTVLFLKPKSEYHLAYACFITLLGFFMFMTKMHERYMLPALIFAALAILWDKRLIWIYVALSLCQLGNTWFIYEALKTVHPWVSANNRFANLVSTASVFLTGYVIYYGWRNLTKNFNIKTPEAARLI